MTSETEPSNPMSKGGRLLIVACVAVALLPIFFFALPWLLGLLIEDWGIFLFAIAVCWVDYAIGLVVAVLRVAGATDASS